MSWTNRVDLLCAVTWHPHRVHTFIVLNIFFVVTAPYYIMKVVITEKLDGGNCLIHRGAVFARSLRQQATHGSFSMAKALARGEWAHLLPPHLAIVAENMQGVHSIE